MNISKIFRFILFVFLSSSISINAQTVLPTGTLFGFNNFTNPNGVVIQSGNTVTVASGAVVQFNFGLRIDSGAVLIVNDATILMGDSQRVVLVQAQSADTSHHGGKLVLNSFVIITGLNQYSSGAFWQGIAHNS